MGNTKIAWATKVWNPVTGCTPISEGCEHCYAKRMARRLAGRCGYPGGDGFTVTAHPEHLNDPFTWNKPERVFVCSMGDLFHGEVGATDVIAVWGVMQQCPQHTFMVLTKRPRSMQYACERLPVLSNVWLGVTAENQERADERIPILLATPAAKRFVSCEPLLGPVRLQNVIMPDGDCLSTHFYNDGANAGIDWVIAGCESGPGRRATMQGWFVSLAYQCINARVPFFLKQMDIDGQIVHSPMIGGRTWQEFPR
jgi:protein gp37